MERRLDSRPRLCPDISGCVPVFKGGIDADFDKGASFNCIGKLEKPFTYTWKDTVHENNLSDCLFYPHGIQRTFVNIDDLKNYLRLFAHILVRIDTTFNWARLEGWATGKDKLFEKFVKLHNDCDSRVCPPEGGLVKCKHTDEACSYRKCPIYIWE